MYVPISLLRRLLKCTTLNESRKNERTKKRTYTHTHTKHTFNRFLVQEILPACTTCAHTFQKPINVLKHIQLIFKLVLLQFSTNYDMEWIDTSVNGVFFLSRLALFSESIPNESIASNDIRTMETTSGWIVVESIVSEQERARARKSEWAKEGSRW